MILTLVELLLFVQLAIAAYGLNVTLNSIVDDARTTRKSSTINGQAIATSSGEIIFFLSNHTSIVIPPDEHFPHRIVGGEAIPIREAPFQAALFRRNSFYCGGSVLSHYWVLTAAHCVTESGPFFVRAGTRAFRSGGQMRQVQRVVRHSRYNPRTSNHDVALLKVRSRFSFEGNVRPVKLAHADWKLPRRYFVTGWGLKNEDGWNPARFLRRVQVNRISRSSCNRDYRGVTKITKNMICAAAPGKDSCSGDSGGPLMRHGHQYGIVSFGFGCARSNYPGVYTDVRKVRKFISSTMKRY